VDDGDTTVVLVIGYGHDLKLDTSIVKPDIDHCVSFDHRISGIAHGLQNVLIANPVLARRAGDADLPLTIVTDTKVEGQSLWRLQRAVDVVLFDRTVRLGAQGSSRPGADVVWSDDDPADDRCDSNKHHPAGWSLQPKASISL